MQISNVYISFFNSQTRIFCADEFLCTKSCRTDSVGSKCTKIIGLYGRSRIKLYSNFVLGSVRAQYDHENPAFVIDIGLNIHTLAKRSYRTLVELVYRLFVQHNSCPTSRGSIRTIGTQVVRDTLQRLAAIKHETRPPH